MKYLTPEWCHGDIDEAEHQDASEKYQKHLDALLPQWPPDVQALASRISLHDGLIRELCWNTDEATLHLRLRCGDNQVGYFDFDLHYSGVFFSPLDWGSLMALSANKNSSALYDEVDEDAGQFVHRVLFISYRRVRRSRRFGLSRGIRLWNRIKSPRRFRSKSRYHEITIRFEELHLVITLRESRFDTNGSNLA